MSWDFGTFGFHSTVEFDPPLVKVTPTEYGTKVNARGDTVTDYTKIIKEAEYGTERVCQEQIDQLKDYTPATKTHLSSHLLVRARIKEDLECLKEFDPNAVFFEDLTADYQYRCIISRKAMAQFRYNYTMKIDYNSHVKETMEREAPKIPGGRYSVLSSIWSLVSKWQPNPPYGSTWTSYGSTSYTKGTPTTTTGEKYGGFAQAKTKDSPTGTAYKVGQSPYNYYYDKTNNAWVAEGDEIDNWVEVEDFDIDVDNPGEDDNWTGEDVTEEDIHEALKGGKPSFDTMRVQLREVLTEANLLGTVDLDTAVDALVESFGTCDVEGVHTRELFDVIYSLPAQKG